MKAPIRMPRLLLVVSGLALCVAAVAQQPVYRCDVAGKASYSHEPCLGAKHVDTTPTQGMDKMSGKSIKGTDVRQREHRDMVADALKPLTGMTPDQYRVHQRRTKLGTAATLECARLDGQLSGSAQQAGRGIGVVRQAIDADLYQARRRFKDLGC